ncbi:oligopeptidase A [Thiohalospira sp.]|uniref:oligopeptidase A n=1 Tax=Thiohalospira sp. TaxID=3080549 RepID=UPI003980BA1D
MADADNPLLSDFDLPPFSAIRPEHVEPAIDTVLAENRQWRADRLAAGGPWTWENLLAPFEAAEDRLGRIWAPVSHMNSVVNGEALREAYNACLPKLSEHGSELAQDEGLYAALKELAASDHYRALSPSKRRVVDNALRDFRLGGAELSGEDKARFKAIASELATLSARYEENVLDATQAWYKVVTDEARLAGLPEQAREQARQSAADRGEEGWVFTLDFPSFYAVMTFADDRALREEVYTAWGTRASDQGPHAGRWDNSETMERILALRHEQAQLLGFRDYAEYSLATKMAPSPEEVIAFLQDLADRALPQARRELDELTAFAREELGLDDLQPWDIAWAGERLRQARYDLSEEDLRPWFPETKVIPGLFAVVERLYGLTIREVEGADVWHDDVRLYAIRDADGETRGMFYLDLYARRNKRGGAWMDECRIRHRREDGTVQVPVAFLTCNLSAPVGDKPALFTHDEVVTLFHEFGHGLHHMLTRVDEPSVAGINGVEWDAVELPSQFLENWCWQREAIDLISGHYETGEPLPAELFERMNAARNFHAALQMVRQLEFSLFDFRLHRDYDPDAGGRILETLWAVREQVAVVHPPAWHRFPHNFAHIFAGGYAAGYYSYKWAEVLSADAFERFEEEGIFNTETGRAFLSEVLEVGGSRDAMDSFIAFRGREPQVDALLRHNGLDAA